MAIKLHVIVSHSPGKWKTRRYGPLSKRKLEYQAAWRVTREPGETFSLCAYLTERRL